MEVAITGRNLELAIKSFRKKTQKEGLVKEARQRKAYEKPSIKKKRKAEESVARRKRKITCIGPGSVELCIAKKQFIFATQKNRN